MADFSNIFGTGAENMTTPATIQDLNDICSPLEVMAYRKLAIEIAVDVIANTFVQTAFVEYDKGKQTKGTAYQLLNIKTNQVDTSKQFMKKVARHLLLHNEALIIPVGSELYLADKGFGREFTGFSSVKYTTVKINTYKAPQAVYTNNQVIYLTLDNEELLKFLRQYQVDYNNVVNSATGSYQSNKLKKYYVESDAYRAQTSKIQADFNAMVENNMRSFLRSTQSVSIFAKPKGYEISQLQDSQLETASDVRGLISDVFNMTASAFHIPSELLYGGNPNQLMMDNFIMSAVNPLVTVMVDGFNNWNYKPQEIIQDTLIKADTTSMKVTDLDTVGNFIQKVFPTGALTLGDIITKYLHLDTPSDDIKDLRVITKNYGTVEQFMNGDFVTTNTTNKNTDMEDAIDANEIDN